MDRQGGTHTDAPIEAICKCCAEQQKTIQPGKQIVRQGRCLPCFLCNAPEGGVHVNRLVSELEQSLYSAAFLLFFVLLVLLLPYLFHNNGRGRLNTA